jgi:hypothetical protein
MGGASKDRRNVHFGNPNIKAGTAVVAVKRKPRLFPVLDFVLA